MRISRSFYLILFTTCFSFSVNGQNKVDSILTLIHNDKEDTIKVLHLISLSYQYDMRDESGKAIAMEDSAMTLSGRLNYSDGYRNTPEIILSGLEKVKEALKQAEIDIEIEAAAEYYYDFEFENKIKAGNVMTFGKKYLLWEVPFINPPENMNQVIFEMATRGYKPVLAHVERYGFWQQNFEKYEELADRGVLLQMNINSVTGHYSIPTRKAAQWLIERNMISFVGSDCHHIGHIELIKKAVTDKHFQKLLTSDRLLNKTL